MTSSAPLHKIKEIIEGDILEDQLHKIIYATDASVYRELPVAVAIPKTKDDLISIVKICYNHELPLIPRAAGTSLAGQCVGNGLIVDVSKHLNNIIEINADERWVKVQPGLIRDELNHYLKPYGLFFGPNTSTSNRATLGGMVGNNSCGTTSIVYGNTRDHVLSMEVILADGTVAQFSPISIDQARKISEQDNLLGDIYKSLLEVLQDKDIVSEIEKELPNKNVTRRNTGYAIDELIESSNTGLINPITILCGSEGTLALTSEITLSLNVLPPDNEIVMAVHFKDVIESLKAVPFIMEHKPYACELMDKTILDCTKDQRSFAKDRKFLEGDPQAILLISFREEAVIYATEKLEILKIDLAARGLGYSYPIIIENVERLWNLRKAGLGLLANIPGDEKAVACIEDTAVSIDILADYIQEFEELMSSFGQRAVYYAHAGAGELHLRPILNLKLKQDRQLFEEISFASARLVKKYNGSLSGEHGDGRVRAPFLSYMVGAKLYEVFEKIKVAFDAKNIFNPGKIVHPKSITDDLRYEENQSIQPYETIFDFSSNGGILATAEKCNGSGDCRKLAMAGGTMCPSYQATRDEKDTTRARANVLREILTRSTKENPFESHILEEAMDLCLSCKGCTSECPSGVNMTQLKSEYLYQKYRSSGLPLRSKIFSRIAQFNSLQSKNVVFRKFGNAGITRRIAKKILNVHPKRSLPILETIDYRSKKQREIPKNKVGEVYIFLDEFTNYYDTRLAHIAHKLLVNLGYHVNYVEHDESGRAAFSKGDLDYAKRCARNNVETFRALITDEVKLIGIEPSCILSFRDEYPLIVGGDLKEEAINLKSNCLLIEEFIYQEAMKGNISGNQFVDDAKCVHVHGHCHQKALSDMEQVGLILSMPKNYDVSIIPSGCCGMAGSFGYEKEHYDISMKIGETTLFPYIRALEEDAVVVASGTSCRHQIKDGVNQVAYHPIEVLYAALKEI